MLRNLVLMLSLVGFFYGCSSDDGDKKTPAGNTSNIPAELKSLATLTNNLAFGMANIAQPTESVFSNLPAPGASVEIGMACNGGTVVGTATHAHSASTHTLALKDVCFDKTKINGTMSMPTVAAAIAQITANLSINVAGRTLTVKGAEFIVSAVSGEVGLIVSLNTPEGTSFTVTDENNVTYTVKALNVDFIANASEISTVSVAGIVEDPKHGIFTIAFSAASLPAGQSQPRTGSLVLTNETKNQRLSINYSDAGYSIVFDDNITDATPGATL